MDLCCDECYYSGLCVLLSMFVYFVMVNCLLNAFAICVDEVTVLYLKVIVLCMTL